MLRPTLSDNTLADIQTLVDEKARETKTLEFKLKFYEISNKAVRDKQIEELLKDISAFSNTSGGDLVIGVKAIDGVAVSVDGFTCDNPDQLCLTIHELVDRWIEPRIGISIHYVHVKDDRYVFIIRANRSILAPHRIVHLGIQGQFYMRNSAGAYNLDTEQLRQAFTFTQSIFDKMKAFRDSRITQIKNDSTPISIQKGARFVVHLLPLDAFGGLPSYNIQDMMRKSLQLKLINTTVKDSRVNADGVLIVANHHPDVVQPGYIQIFRNGCIEIVAGEAAYQIPDSKTMRIKNRYMTNLGYELTDYLKYLESLSVPLPVWIFASFIGVKGCIMYYGRNWHYVKPPIDRDIITLPEAEVNDFATQPEEILKPMIEVLWNAGGHEVPPTLEQLINEPSS